MGSRLGRRLAAASLLGVLFGSVGAMPVAAGAEEYGILATIGDPCINIRVTTAGTVVLVQKRGGRQIAKRTYQAPSTQLRCLKPLKAGDRVIVSLDGVVKRTIVVPRLELTVDRAANTVAGTVPVGGSDYSVFAQDRVAGMLSTLSSVVIGTAEPDGTFGPWPTSPVDLAAGDPVDLMWTTADGSDEWHRSVSSRSVTVQVGWAQVSGTAQAGSKAVVTLRSPAGAVRGRLSTRAIRSGGVQHTFSGTLRRQGAAARVRAGDRVAMVGLTGVFRVPATTLQVDPESGALSATCPKGAEWAVAVNGTTVSFGTTADGTIEVASLPGSPFPGGTIVALGCQRASGHGYVQVLTMPSLG